MEITDDVVELEIEVGGGCIEEVAVPVPEKDTREVDVEKGDGWVEERETETVMLVAEAEGEEGTEVVGGWIEDSGNVPLEADVEDGDPDVPALTELVLNEDEAC
ncbi:hypothetical protein C8R44DRAFT_726220 [Mycena epipterygia]|nr:hypothetical protein C8R44DRAFT_726220 [Mycena epipterygia]